MAKKTEEGEQDFKLEEPKVEVLQAPTKMGKDMLLNALKDKDARQKMLRDETLEPHIHLAALLVVVFALAVLIMVIY